MADKKISQITQIETAVADGSWLEGERADGTSFRIAGSNVKSSMPGAGSVTAGTVQEVYNVKHRFGTTYASLIGNGNSKPLSAHFGSLAAAQAVFPAATALTDEMDWAATQSTIDAVAASTARTGWVYSPTGLYICNKTIRFPTYHSTYPGTSVNWKGDSGPIGAEGGWATEYHWPTDLGPGTFAVDWKTDRTNANCMGQWEGIVLRGSGNTSLNTPPRQQSGWAWASDRRMVRCGAFGFYKGLSVIGGQSSFDNCNFNDNYYSGYWETEQNMYGDLVFTKCYFANGKLAAIGISGAFAILGCTFVGCHIGSSPYAFWKELGDNTDDKFGHDCVFIDLQSEDLGNQFCGSERSGGGTWNNCRFYQVFVHTNTGKTIVAGDRPRTSTFDATFANVYMQLKGENQTFPGTTNIFNIRGSDGFHIVANMELMFWSQGPGGAGKRLFAGLPHQRDGHKIKIENKHGNWEGRVCKAGGTITEGMPLQYVGSAETVVACDTTAAARPAGIARDAGSSGQWVIVATKGITYIVGSSALTLGRAAVRAAGGTLVSSDAPTLNGLMGTAVSTTYLKLQGLE